MKKGRRIAVLSRSDARRCVWFGVAPQIEDQPNYFVSPPVEGHGRELSGVAHLVPLTLAKPLDLGMSANRRG
jgi:hypothetical protein